MAAVTVDTIEDSVFGNKLARIAKLSSVDNADTWDTGLNKIDAIWLTPETGAAIGCTISGGVVTFANAGTLIVRATALGT